MLDTVNSKWSRIRQDGVAKERRERPAQTGSGQVVFFFFFPVAAKNKIILNSLTDQC